MAKSKYSHNCCGEDSRIPLEENTSMCQSPENSTTDILKLTNDVKKEFEKIVKSRNIKRSTSRGIAPYIEYTEDELIYIPCWVHNIRENLEDKSYEEFAIYAQEVIDAINEQLEGVFEDGVKNDDTHGVECRLRLKIPQKVPKSWLNPLFKENRKMPHWWQNITWNGSSYNEDPDPDGRGVNTVIEKSDPYLDSISNENGVTNYWNQVGIDSNFKNYYSIPVLTEGNERDEYFWGGPHGVVFNWPSLFMNSVDKYNPNIYAQVSNYYDGNYFANGTVFEREIKGLDTHNDYVALTPIALGPSGANTHTTKFEACGNLSPVIARFPGINLVFTDASGGKASFPQSTASAWSPPGTTTGFGSQVSIAGHELGHSLGLQHVFSGSPNAAETRVSFVSPLFNGETKIDFFKNTTNLFTPPFEYISEDYNEDYDQIKDFEQIDNDEKTYVENVINNGVRLATKFFGGSVDFNKGTVETPMSVNNTYLNNPGDEEALDVTEFFAILPRIPSFWGGSYIENTDGSKSMVVNPSEISNSNRNASSSIPDLSSLSASYLPQIGEKYNNYYVYDVEYKISGLSLYAVVKSIYKNVDNTNKSLSASPILVNVPGAGPTDFDKAMAQHQRWERAWQDTSQVGSSEAPYASDIWYDSNASIEDYIYIGFPSEYALAKERLIDPANGLVSTLGNNELSYAVYDAEIGGGSGQYIWTSKAIISSKSALFSMNSGVTATSSDNMFWYYGGNSQLANDPAVRVRPQQLRQKKYRITLDVHINALKAQGISLPDYVDVETIEGRKGPNVTTYVPFCKMVEVINEETGEGTGEYIQSTEFDPFWYINFNWLNPKFPKYPENWPVSKLYDAEDSEGNPLCPCLHTSQHYYYEKPGDPITVDEEMHIPFTMELVEYIPINAVAQDLVFANGSNVVDSDGIGGTYGYWNTYGEMPTNNGTDAYKLYMLYMYLDYKWNLDPDNTKYGQLMTHIFNDDGSHDYFNKEHFFGVSKTSAYCGNQMVHGAFMEVYTNTLEFKNHYPAARRYGARIHSFPHGRGVFFENHILDKQCNNCEESNIEVPYWAYTGVFAQGAVPLQFKLNTASFTEQFNSFDPTSFSAPAFYTWNLDLDGITDTGRDTSWTPAYTSASFNEKGTRSSMYLYGYGKYDCLNTSTYRDNSIWFSPSIVLKFAFGNSDPNSDLYNPFRHPDASIYDIHSWYKRENDAQKELAGKKSIGLNFERGSFNNIMHYSSGTQLKGYENNSDNPFTTTNTTTNISASSQYVFSPDQIAKMEAIVISRYSIYNRAMLFADEINLRDTPYSVNSDVKNFFEVAKNNIKNITDSYSPEVSGEVVILGDYNKLIANGVSIEVLSSCFSQDINICNSDYNSSVLESLYPNISTNILLPKEENTYGPVFAVDGISKVYYYNPSLCCEALWSLEHSSCIQDVDALAIKDCSHCQSDILSRSSKKETKKYNVYVSAGLELIVQNSSLLTPEIYSGKVISHEGYYYTFSVTQPKSLKLVYNRDQDEINNVYEKFKKYSEILNKISNFAR